MAHWGPAEIGPISAKLIGLDKISGRMPATQWPFAVFTRALIAHYEATGDRKVLDALTTTTSPVRRISAWPRAT